MHSYIVGGTSCAAIYPAIQRDIAKHV